MTTFEKTIRLTLPRTFPCFLVFWVVFNGFSLSAVAQAALSSDHLGGRLVWSTEAVGPRRFVAVHGHRSAVFGYSENGLEVWAYPLQILNTYTVAFLQRGATRAIEGQAVLRRVEYRPESITRIYVGPDFVVREKLFVPLDLPGAVFSYETVGARPVDVLIRFIPSLDLMWPASVGGQAFSWDQTESAYLLAEPSNRFVASVGSPDIIGHDDTANPALPAVHGPELAFTIRPPSGQKTAHVVIAAGSDSPALARTLLSTEAALEGGAAVHYADVIKNATQIETPDSDVNRALLWAEMAVNQQWVCTPDLGCGEVAGYGPSRPARRPQYDWFFEDGMVAVRAYLADCQYDRARQELEFIAKYQDKKTGMVWHELSLSAPFMDWAATGSYFAGIGASFEYLSTSAEYVSITGDRQFLKDHWASFLSAWRYCLTVIDPNDGLPHIPRDKVGDNEEDQDRGDSLNLADRWLKATLSFAEISSVGGYASEAEDARKRCEFARRSIIEHYWDEKQRGWISAHTRSGTPSGDGELLPAAALTDLPVTPQQRDVMLDEIASSDFQTDWGIRSKSANAPTFDPNLYFSGSVWAIGTADSVVAFEKEHRPITAECDWYALVPWGSLDALGHMHEVLAADLYHEETESVPEQMWSSAAFFWAAAKGLFGITVDGFAHRLTLAPHLPPEWDVVRVSHQRVADAMVAFNIKQAPDQVQLELDNDGPQVAVVFDPEIPLGASSVSAQIDDRPLPANLEQNLQDTHARVEFSLPRGHTSVTIRFRGGVTILPPLPSSEIGEPSRGLKIRNVALNGRRLTLDMERTSPEFSSFVLRTEWKLGSAEGAQVEEIEPHHYRVTVNPTIQAAHPQAYQRAGVTLQFGDGE